MSIEGGLFLARIRRLSAVGLDPFSCGLLPQLNDWRAADQPLIDLSLEKGSGIRKSFRSIKIMCEVGEDLCDHFGAKTPVNARGQSFQRILAGLLMAGAILGSGTGDGKLTKYSEEVNSG